jgi:hypothetical protein
MSKEKEYTSETLFWLWIEKCPVNKFSVKTERKTGDGKTIVNIDFTIPETDGYLEEIVSKTNKKLEAIMKGGHYSDDS